MSSVCIGHQQKMRPLTSESCDGTTTEQSRGRGGAKRATQDVKGAVFIPTRLFCDEMGSWQLLDVEMELKYWIHPVSNTNMLVSILLIFGSVHPLLTCWCLTCWCLLVFSSVKRALLKWCLENNEDAVPLRLERICSGLKSSGVSKAKMESLSWINSRSSSSSQKERWKPS